MVYDDRKKKLERDDCTTYVFTESESTFSGLHQDILNSDGSEEKQGWSFPYIKYRSLKESR